MLVAASFENILTVPFPLNCSQNDCHYTVKRTAVPCSWSPQRQAYAATNADRLTKSRGIVDKNGPASGGNGDNEHSPVVARRHRTSLVSSTASSMFLNRAKIGKMKRCYLGIRHPRKRLETKKSNRDE